jgi:hypothetical protein
MPPFAQAHLVVAAPTNPRPRWLGRRAVEYCLLQCLNGLHARGYAVDRHHPHTEAGQVTVCIDEAGEQRAPPQLDLAYTGTREGTNRRGAADGEDTPATESDRFDAVVLHIDGVAWPLVKLVKMMSPVALLCVLSGNCIS